MFMNELACGFMIGYSSETLEHVDYITNFEQFPSQNMQSQLKFDKTTWT